MESGIKSIVFSTRTAGDLATQIHRWTQLHSLAQVVTMTQSECTDGKIVHITLTILYYEEQ